MKLLILGATGPTGRHLVDLALKRGDSVTVLVRNPTAIADLADRLTVVVGDAASQEDVATAMRGQEAVLSALGKGKLPFPSEIFTRASAAVVGPAASIGRSSTRRG